MSSDRDVERMLGKPKLDVYQMLGMPPEKELKRLALAAAKAADAEVGISARSMAKACPAADWLSWTDILASLNREGRLVSRWGPCREGGAAVLQECRYVLPGERG